VADGRWLHARALVSPGGWAAGSRRGARRDRSWALRPQERLAALLGARNEALLCEELALRARQDLDHGRVAHAALELDRAYTLAVPELESERRQDLAIRIAELEQLRPGVQEQAHAALLRVSGAPGTTATGARRGPDARADAPEATLDDDALTHALERLEAALRARTAAGL
jgi:hypothetical protein